MLWSWVGRGCHIVCRDQSHLLQLLQARVLPAPPRTSDTRFHTTHPTQISSSSGFINTWLVGYSALLGPVIGVVMADYWLVRRCKLDVDSLYTKGEKSLYWYKVRGASICTCRMHWQLGKVDGQWQGRCDMACDAVMRNMPLHGPAEIPESALLLSTPWSSSLFHRQVLLLCWKLTPDNP